MEGVLIEATGAAQDPTVSDRQAQLKDWCLALHTTQSRMFDTQTWQRLFISRSEYQRLYFHALLAQIVLRISWFCQTATAFLLPMVY